MVEVTSFDPSSSAPISASITRSIDAVFAKLPPSSGRGYLKLDAALTGATLEIGQRFGFLSVGGWVGIARRQRLEAGFRLSAEW